MITIIDYNAGNLKSVQNALNKIGTKSLVTKKPEDILKAEKIIFPGVGAAGAAMTCLRQLGLINPIKTYIKSGRPFLGICLGAQILLDYSEEDNTKCLGIIKGSNKKYKSQKLSIPQMGWNQVKYSNNNKLFKGIPDNSFFYFLNSYYLDPQEKNIIISQTEYNNKFTSAINKKNIYAVQFHPEKSAGMGLILLNNFIKLC